MAATNGFAGNGVGWTRDALLEAYYHLQLTRQVEQALTHLYRQNKVIGGLYVSLGQEATAVGSALALRRRSDGRGDVLAPAIRNLGALLVLGARPVDIFRQYMARGDSPTGGREQNVHFTDLERGWIGLISHLGVMIEVLAGVALSFQLRREERVALAYIGDGAVSTGAFHEGFNLAAVRRAPLVVIVENNGYAFSTPLARQTAAESFVAKAPGYGVWGDRCDGNDLFAVHAMTERAVARARAGEGAALLEVVTYRRRGHAEHDDQHYVPPGELARWEANDPIARFEERCLAGRALSDADMSAVRERVSAEVAEARDVAQASGLPAAEGALFPVWSEGVPPVPWTRQADLAQRAGG